MLRSHSAMWIHLIVIELNNLFGKLFGTGKDFGGICKKENKKTKLN